MNRYSALRADHEGGDDLAAVDLLARAGHDAGLDQVDHAVGEHLGVDAQVALVAQRAPRPLRDRPDPQLQGRAIRDQLGHVLADPPLHVADAGVGCVVVRRHVDLDARSRSGRRG